MRRTVLSKILLVSLLMGIGMQARGAKPKAAASLEKTEWKLIWLGGTKIESATPQQMAYLQLDPESHNVSGSGGCNRLMGTYELEGAHLQFTKMAMTRMACLHGNETEASFSQALDQAREWKVVSGKLLLMDGDRHVVAKFAPMPQT